ncbi:MAG TPA: c-type cytochrome, partial [Thermoanaerobaculia bacterium]|nr:c-type cytochrome [Thermoanaerobaculia bacterium]
ETEKGPQLEENQEVVTATIAEGEPLAAEIQQELEPGETATVTATITEAPLEQTPATTSSPARVQSPPASATVAEERPATPEPATPSPEREAPAPAPAPVSQPRPAPVASASGSTSEGASIFKAQCGACHGADGSGATPMGKKLEIGSLASERVQGYSDERLTEVIRSGIDEPSQKAHRSKKLSDAQVRDVIAFIRSLS